MKVFDSYRNKKWSGRKFKVDGNSVLMPKKSTMFQTFAVKPGTYNLKILSKKRAGNGKVKVVVVTDKKACLLSKEFSPSSSWTEFNFSINVESRCSITMNLHRLFPVAFGTVEIGRVVLEASSKTKKEKKVERKKKKHSTPAPVEVEPPPEETYKKTIAFVIPYKIYGGAEVYLKNLLNCLDDTHYRYHIVYRGGNMMKSKLRAGIEHSVVKTEGHFSALLKSMNFDYIVYYNSLNVYNSLVFLKKNDEIKSKLIEIYHSDFEWPDALSKVRMREHVELIIKIAPSLCLDIDVKQLLIPVGIDLNKFSSFPIHKSRSSVKNNVGKVFGTVARISKEKNIQYIIELASLMPNDLFIIAGTGPLIGKLQAISPPNVKFVGFVSEIEGFYGQLDAFILPSKMEGMPISIVEAMASRIPVFCSNVGSISDFIENQYNGVFLSMNSGDDVKLIHNTLRDSELVSTMISNAFDDVQKSNDILKNKEIFIKNIHLIDDFFILNDGTSRAVKLVGEFI